MIETRMEILLMKILLPFFNIDNRPQRETGRGHGGFNVQYTF